MSQQNNRSVDLTLTEEQLSKESERGKKRRTDFKGKTIRHLSWCAYVTNNRTVFLSMHALRFISSN